MEVVSQLSRLFDGHTAALAQFGQMDVFASSADLDPTIDLFDGKLAGRSTQMCISF
jgi:hypothetical protein